MPTLQEKKEYKEMIEDSRLLMYGDIEPHLDEYLPMFFSVDIKDVGFNDDHPLNTLEFWYTVSWLNEMRCINYGTSPRGAWLTEKGENFKKYVLAQEKPITHLMYEIE